MSYASVQGVLRTILIILLVYYGVKIALRYFGPVLLAYITKKAGEKFQQRFDTFQRRSQNRTNQTEGEVTIERPKSKPSRNSSEGEYIDYEEID